MLHIITLWAVGSQFNNTNTWTDMSYLLMQYNYFSNKLDEVYGR